MLGSGILDVTIGLIMIFLLLSLICSAVREAIEAVLKTRAVHLELGIRELLGGAEAAGILKRLYEHPNVFGLYRGTYQSANSRLTGGNLPTYIPSRSFASALLDIARRGQHASVYAAAHNTPDMSMQGLRDAVRRLPNAQLRHALTTAIDNGRNDLGVIEANVAAWFDASMDRVSGWYKRRTQLYLLLIGLVVSVALNVNAITIANHLWSDKAARDALVHRAEVLKNDTLYQRLVTNSDTASTTDAARRLRASLEDVESLHLPIGWDNLPPRARSGGASSYYMKIVFGLLITTFAVSLGAPFWFDTLNRIMVIRSTVKPHEKSREEGSEDRQDKTPTQIVVQGTGAAADASQPDATAPPQQGGPPPQPANFTARAWATGDSEEGVL